MKPDPGFATADRREGREGAGDPRSLTRVGVEADARSEEFAGLEGGGEAGSHGPGGGGQAAGGSQAVALHGQPGEQRRGAVHRAGGPEISAIHHPLAGFAESPGSLSMPATAFPPPPPPPPPTPLLLLPQKIRWFSKIRRPNVPWRGAGSQPRRGGLGAACKGEKKGEVR